MAAHLQQLFNPQSVAIVGVSSDPHKVGYLVLRNMLEQGYRGKLYGISVKGGEVLGQKLYTSLDDIPSVDLVVFATPANITLSLFPKLKEKSIHAAVIFAAGFKEIHTKEGDMHEQTLVQAAKDCDVTILGPNCIGYANAHLGVNATFFRDIAPMGNIGFISQSGALGSILMDTFAVHPTHGFSYFMSAGNKSIIDETDMLQFLAADETTCVIGMYLEDIKRGPQFLDALRTATMQKSVFILKSGSSPEGAKAALSHTGSLAGDDAVFTSAVESCGAVRVHTFEELYHMLLMGSLGRIPQRPETLILSNAGGVAVLMSDELSRLKLPLETISEEEKNRIQVNLPPNSMISVHNPIDVLGDASQFAYKAVIDATRSEKDIGATMVLLTPQANTPIQETAEVIIQAQKETDHPLLPVFMGSKSVRLLDSTFLDAGIMSFADYSLAARCLAYARKAARSTSGKRESNPSQPDQKPCTIPQLFSLSKLSATLTPVEGQRYLSLEDATTTMQTFELPVVPLTYVQTVDDAEQHAQKLGYPVVIKTASKETTHKTETGGVIVGVKTRADIETAFAKLSPNGEGVYVQKQLKGPELFLGVKRDATFGIVVVVGLGGIYAELLKKTWTFVHPLDSTYMQEILAGTEVDGLLNGFRDGPKSSLAELIEVMRKAACVLEKLPTVSSLDINPLLITEDGLKAVDCRIIL